MAAFVGRARVTGDAFPLGEEFHHRGTEADVELLAHQRVGDGVVMAFDLHVVIDIHPGELPLGILIGLYGQRSECWAVEGLKQGLQALLKVNLRLAATDYLSNGYDGL
jgi:hypothetical protein